MREVFNTNCAVELNNLKQGLQETMILCGEISGSAHVNRAKHGRKPILIVQSGLMFAILSDKLFCKLFLGRVRVTPGSATPTPQSQGTKSLTFSR